VLIVHGVLELQIPSAHSLKGRRRIVTSIMDRLKGRNISLLDLSSSYPREALIAFVFLALNHPGAQQKLGTIQRVVERSFPEIDFDLSYEIL